MCVRDLSAALARLHLCHAHGARGGGRSDQNRRLERAARDGVAGRQRPIDGELSLPVLTFAMSSTCISRHIDAPRAAVYRALLDPRAVAAWRVPAGMTSRVHAFDPREGGSFRISLTYDGRTGTGKTAAHTDTYHGVFAKLVADKQVVEVVEFETMDPALRGEMTITTTLADADGGTDLFAVHDRLPPGLSAVADGTCEARGVRRGRLEHARSPTVRVAFVPSNNRLQRAVRCTARR